MPLKRFRLALNDCQNAATIQSTSPNIKTLVRLSRCHLALGSPTPALASIREALAIEPTNCAALQLREKVQELESRLKQYESSRTKKEWTVARFVLDKCLQSIDAESDEAPVEWQLWVIELDVARKSWDVANAGAR
jgi:DnaJ homolog subfamily C member 7